MSSYLTGSTTRSDCVFVLNRLHSFCFLAGNGGKDPFREAAEVSRYLYLFGLQTNVLASCQILEQQHSLVTEFLGPGGPRA